MKITTLMENSRLEARKDLQAEHGLSLHVQRDDLQILFDAGASDAFVENALRLGINLAQVDLGVLSHHHYDHGGGLDRFFQVNERAKVYLQRCEVKAFSFRALGVIRKNIGLDPQLFVRHAERFVYLENAAEIAPGVHLLTKIIKPFPLPKGNNHLYAEVVGGRVLDPFDHELIMVMQDEGGLVVFTGCSHSGILNMIATVVERFPGEQIKAVIGGFHLIGIPLLNTMAGSKDEVEDIGEAILAYPVDKVYTGHCTGSKAYRILKGVMGEVLDVMQTGTRFEL